MTTSARALSLVLALGLTAATAGAAPRRSAPARSQPRPSAYGGYSYTHAGEADLHGWTLSGSYPLRGSLSVAADLSGHYGSFAQADLNQLGLMAGLRRSWHLRPVRPFAEVLVGAVRTRTTVEVGGLTESVTSWGVALGGGADYPLSSRWAARALVHLRLLHGNGVWDTDPRLSIGAVYSFRH